MSDTKLCLRCDTKKNLDTFGRDKSSPDKINKFCKACLCIISAEYKKNNPEKRRVTQRKAGLKYQRRIRKEYPEQHLAQEAIAYQRKKGFITFSPCHCGAKGEVGHHDSYKEENRLIIRSMCIPCHAAWHSIRIYNPNTMGFDLRSFYGAN